MLFPPPPSFSSRDRFLPFDSFHRSRRKTLFHWPNAICLPTFLLTYVYVYMCTRHKGKGYGRKTYEKSKRREHSSPFEIYFFGEEKVATIIRDIIIFQLLITVYVIERLYVISVYKLNNNKIN